jgi:hypothetical protein
VGSIPFTTIHNLSILSTQRADMNPPPTAVAQVR